MAKTGEMEPEVNVSQIEIPRLVPVLINPQFILFPFMIAPLLVKNEADKGMIDDVVQGSRVICVFAPSAQEAPEPTDGDGSEPADAGEPPAARGETHEVGTLAMVLRMLKIPDGTRRLLVHGVARVRSVERVMDGPYPQVRV